ncbi:5'-nucleotidase like protein [Argiope bruennichi]|uniref:5'-nucleotidase n=1 Tax=Argiope bruennichi TaxID=94029 RepID=A0A8T0EL03_ARGBR|nr:5'-nucleotidase like protein [Argiope bruennichi]
MIAKIFGFVTLLLLTEQAWSEFNLTVVHISDFHSHWFEFNDRERPCSNDESKAEKCFGGFPRLLNLVRDIRRKEKNVIVLSSGEFFLERSFNPLHGWKVANVLLPRLDLDAMSLSNHDFSSGIFELSSFLYGVKLPILCANMWARETSFLYSRVNKSAVIDINGEKIGIVGYIHPETLESSRKAVSVKFTPEIPAIKEEVKRLESHGINKIIALGHSDYYTDLEIAKNVNGVDIVIGGNSDIVLEEPYDDEDEFRTKSNIHGNYPSVHHHEDSNATEAELKNRTLVLHIPQHGKYVGVIRVSFDEHGRVVQEEGNPVLLDSSIPQDVETLNYLKNAQSILEEVTRNVRLPDDTEVLARAELEFESRQCRIKECSLGNLVTDAILQVYEDNKHTKKSSKIPEKWDHVDAVVFNAGSIRYPLPAGNITIKDLVHSLFVGDFMKIVSMKGEQLVKMMEHSVEKYDPTGVTAPGSFLQISGLRVLYDISDSPGNRVKKLLVRCDICVYNYKEVDPQKTYHVAMPEFISEGGDGYPKFQGADPEDIGQLEILLIVQYLRKMKVIKPILDDRILFVNKLLPRTYAEFIKSQVSSTLPPTATKNLDSSSLATSTLESEKKYISTPAIEKEDREEISLKSTKKSTFRKDKNISSSPASELELTSKMAASEKGKMNAQSVTTPGIQRSNSTTLVTPQPVTKSMESKYNNSKMNHVKVEKSYSYVSLMLGQDLEYPIVHSSEERFLKSKNKSASERKSSKEITKETKAETENIKERNTVLKLKDGNVSHTTNLNSAERETEENKENILVQNYAAASSTRRTIDSTTHKMASNSSMERTWYENDIVDTLNNSLSANAKEQINEFVSPDFVENFIIGEGEVFDVVMKEESSEDTTNSQELTSPSISSSGETTKATKFSKLEEIKSKYWSLVKNSSLSELEKTLINAALAGVNENSVMIDDDDMDRISNNLKAGMNNFLQNKIAVTTMTSADDELATTVKDKFSSILWNSTQSHSIKEPGTEVNPVTQTHITKPITKESIQISNETMKLESSGIWNENITNATNYPKYLAQGFDLNKNHVNEIKNLLVNSVVNSVMNKMKTDIDHKLNHLNSSGSNNNSENINSKKRRIVKKQLKLVAEEMTFGATGEFGTKPTTSTHDSKSNSETHVKTTEISSGKQLTGPKIIANVEKQQKDPVMLSKTQKDQIKEDKPKEVVDWLPWTILGFN